MEGRSAGFLPEENSWSNCESMAVKSPEVTRKKPGEDSVLKESSSHGQGLNVSKNCTLRVSKNPEPSADVLVVSRAVGQEGNTVLYTQGKTRWK